jgi:hypothetical protein
MPPRARRVRSESRKRRLGVMVPGPLTGGCGHNTRCRGTSDALTCWSPNHELTAVPPNVNYTTTHAHA